MVFSEIILETIPYLQDLVRVHFVQSEVLEDVEYVYALYVKITLNSPLFSIEAKVAATYTTYGNDFRRVLGLRWFNVYTLDILFCIDFHEDVYQRVCVHVV